MDAVWCSPRQLVLCVGRVGRIPLNRFTGRLLKHQEAGNLFMSKVRGSEGEQSAIFLPIARLFCAQDLSIFVVFTPTNDKHIPPPPRGGPIFRAWLFPRHEECRSREERLWTDLVERLSGNAPSGLGIVLVAGYPNFDNRSRGM